MRSISISNSIVNVTGASTSATSLLVQAQKKGLLPGGGSGNETEEEDDGEDLGGDDVGGNTLQVDKETIQRLNSTVDSKAHRALMAKLMKEIEAEMKRNSEAADRGSTATLNKRDRYENNYRETQSKKELEELKERAKDEIDDNLRRQIKQLQILAKERKQGLDSGTTSRRAAEMKILKALKAEKKALEHAKETTIEYSTRFTPIVIRDLIWLCIVTLLAIMMIWSYIVAVTTSPGVVPVCFNKKHHITRVRAGSNGAGPGEGTGLLTVSSSSSGSTLQQSQPYIRMEMSTGEKLPHCSKCDVYKPPRTHHCSHCNTCVLRYDHHCFWIGQCVGYFNYKPFLCFLLWTTIFCQVACCTLSRGVYFFFARLVKHNSGSLAPLHSISGDTARYLLQSPSLGSSEVDIYETPFTVILLFAVLFAAGLRAGTILQQHITLVIQNKTTLEDVAYQLDFPPDLDEGFQLHQRLRSNGERTMIFLQRMLCCRGADATLRWRSPYDLGARYNLEEVFGDADGMVGSSSKSICCAPLRGVCQWICRLIPTLAFPRQTNDEVASEDYFSMVDTLRRKHGTSPNTHNDTPGLFPPKYGSVVFDELPPTATNSSNCVAGEFDSLLNDIETTREVNFLLCPRGTHFRVLRSARRTLLRNLTIAYHGFDALAGTEMETEDYESDIEDDDVHQLRSLPKSHTGVVMLPGGKIVEEEMVRVMLSLNNSGHPSPVVSRPPPHPRGSTPKRSSAPREDK